MGLINQLITGGPHIVWPHMFDGDPHRSDPSGPGRSPLARIVAGRAGAVGPFLDGHHLEIGEMVNSPPYDAMVLKFQIWVCLKIG